MSLRTNTDDPSEYLLKRFDLIYAFQVECKKLEISPRSVTYFYQHPLKTPPDIRKKYAHLFLYLDELEESDPYLSMWKS